MANKIKKLCKKAKKGIKKVVSPKKHKTVAKQHSESPIKIQDLAEKPAKPQIESKEGKELKRGISFSNSFFFQKAGEKIKSLRTEPGEKKIKKDGMFKKFKKKIKKLNPIKSKKNKIIGSKKLAFLLSAGTIIAILPMFNLPTFPALAITSACVFSINFIAVKTLKKAIKQRKAKSKTVAEPEKLEDISVEPATQKDPEQISKDLH